MYAVYGSVDGRTLPAELRFVYFCLSPSILPSISVYPIARARLYRDMTEDISLIIATYYKIS